MKILIAEDEPSLRENLQWMLELEGYEVTAACHGGEALAYAQQARPDLVLTDVMMPVLDGYGLIRALREDSKLATVPIIMLTAMADHNDVRSAMNLGADDYLTKPCRREELLEAIKARLMRSSSLEQAAQRLQHEARQALKFDPLTALPGRGLFQQHIHAALQHQHSVALVCLGLDGFSKVNESLGTRVGDLVLQEVGSRLDLFRSQLKQGTELDSVSRLSGDEFSLCWGGCSDEEALALQATELLKRLAAPYEVGGYTLFLTASAGASLYPSQADNAHDLLLNAESALHHAKSSGPNSLLMFDAAMNRRVVRSLQVHNSLYHALAKGDLQVFYQPQVQISTGKLVGFEALLRWQHETLGWISRVRQ